MNWWRTLFACLCLAISLNAAGQDFPTKPIKVIVPYPPGSVPDVIARMVGDKVTVSLGQPFVVENRPGAGGIVAGSAAVRAPADGYTLMMSDTSVMIIAPHLIKHLPYEPMKAFQPIALLARMPYLISASTKSSDIKSIGDLIREAKAHPGAITYGSPGYGSNHHLVMESFAADAGIRLRHVPYVGGVAANTALMAGEIQLAITSIASLAGNANSPTLRKLAVTTPTRFPLSPDVPAVSETLPGFEFTSEAGIVAPTGTPQAIIDKLSAAFKAAIESPDVVERLRQIVMIPAYLSAQAYLDKLNADRTRLEKTIRAAGIQSN